MTKNIIIFGAGASYGSDVTNVPPLGIRLFDALTRFNPTGWGALPNDYGVALNYDFEQGMIKVANEQPYALPILQRAMASYFFNFQPRTSNLYCKFATRLKQSHKNIAVSTLNYERLLEISFTKAGLNLYIGEPNNNEIELNLPHGCCHLFCESVRGVAGAVNFAGLNVEINGEIKIVSDPNEFTHRITQEAFPPVMSYFEPQKRATSGQAFLNVQRERFQHLIKNALSIIVIGVKIREHDSHIWDIIKNANGRFIYCSGESERDSFNSWTLRSRQNKDNVFINGFWAEKFEEVYNQLI